MKSVKKGENEMTKSILPQPENITIIGEPTKNQTDFPPKITLPNTKKGFNELYELVIALSNIHVISYGIFMEFIARKGDPRDIEINMDGVSIFVPIMNDAQRELLSSRILKISKNVFPKRRLKKLQFLAEQLYIYSDYDFAEKVAFNTYCKMTDERKGSKNGKELEHYLTIMSEKILLWMIDIRDTENLKKFLDFGFTSQETLQKIFDNECDDIPTIIKAYLLEQIHQSEKAESDEFSV